MLINCCALRIVLTRVELPTCTSEPWCAAILLEIFLGSGGTRSEQKAETLESVGLFAFNYLFVTFALKMRKVMF